MNSVWEDSSENNHESTDCEIPMKIAKTSGGKRTKKYPNFVFLGTGASLPSKYRNVTCTLVRARYLKLYWNKLISVGEAFLLDCGEGTLNQLLTHYNANESDGIAMDVIRSLKFIYISHLHADHHLVILVGIKVRIFRALLEWLKCSINLQRFDFLLYN